MSQINTIEIVINQWLQSLGDWLRMPMLGITALGYEEFFILLLPALYWSFDQMVGLRMGLVLLMSNTFNTFFKFLFHNPRPFWISDQVKNLSHETSFGLPSGHAQIAASVWGWLAVEIKKRWFSTISLVLIFLIGVSRLYLGVHFLSDVLLGWLLGGLLVWAVSAWHEPIGRWFTSLSFSTKLAVAAGSTVLIVLLIFGARWIAGPWSIDPEWAARSGEIDPYNLDGIFTLGGTWLGMLGGFIMLDSSNGRFKAGAGGWRRIVRLIIGLLVTFLVYYGLGQIFPRNDDWISFVLRFFRYTLIGIWVSWIGPVVFEKIGILDFES